MVKISFANYGYDDSSAQCDTEYAGLNMHFHFMAIQPGPARVKTTEKIRSGTFTAATSMEAGVNCVNDLRNDEIAVADMIFHPPDGKVIEHQLIQLILNHTQPRQKESFQQDLNWVSTVRELDSNVPNWWTYGFYGHLTIHPC